MEINEIENIQTIEKKQLKNVSEIDKCLLDWSRKLG